MDITQSLPHQLLLLELDDIRGKSLISDGTLRKFALNGAIIAELMWRERLVPAKANRFVLSPTRSPAEGFIALAEERLSETKPRKLQACLGRMRHGALRKMVLADLIEQGALQEEQTKLLRITVRRRWYPGENTQEETLIEHMRHHVEHVTHGDPPGREDLLLSLLRVTKLMKTIWSEEELRQLKERIEERTQRTPIGKQIRTAVINEYAASIAAAAAS